MFVRSFVRRFCDICLYQRNMGHRNWVLLLTEETKSAHFGTLKFDHLPRSAVVTFYQLFSKTAKKVNEWYLAVKSEKANKWTRFLSVKTFKNTYFWKQELLIYVILLTSPNITF